MTDGAGVPSPAGVAAFESDAVSPLPLAAGTGVDGDSLTSLESFWSLAAAGDSGLVASSPIASRSIVDGTERVTRRDGLPPDLRRPSGVLVGGAMGEKLVESRASGGRIK